LAKQPRLLKTKELLNSSNDVMSNFCKELLQIKASFDFFQFSLFFVLIQTLVGTVFPQIVSSLE
jgi:hypothetical protein